MSGSTQASGFDSNGREVRITNFEEISKFLHKCTKEDDIMKMERDLISIGVLNEELRATLQEFMAGMQESVNEIKTLVKNHGDAILVHDTKCPHPENWNRVWNRLEAIESNQAQMKHDFDVVNLKTNHEQDLNIKELMVKAEQSGRWSGLISGAAISLIIGVISAGITHSLFK